MLSLTQNELQTIKHTSETEYVPRIEELEGESRKLQGKISELEDAVADANSKVNQVEKSKSRLTLELEDNTIELDRIKNDLSSMEKKQRKVDQMVNEWKSKFEQENGKNEGLVREIQKLSTEGMNLKSCNTEIKDELEAVKRQIRSVQAENQEMTDQLEGGGKQAHEVSKPNLNKTIMYLLFRSLKFYNQFIITQPFGTISF